MKLEKLGRIFKSSGQQPWMASHAQVPVAEQVEGDLYRIYFTSRDGQNRSHITWLEIDITEPQRILRLADQPLLGPGAAGTFDDCGAMSSWVVNAPDRRLFYYIGCNVRNTVSFHNAIGLATAAPGTQPPVLERHSPGPVLDRSPADPYFCSGPCVLLEGGRWRMWYLSGIDWQTIGGKLESRYDIRHAFSDDGIHWRADGRARIGLREPGELAIARPCVIRDADRYRMWYCYRGRDFPYRIGYAESPDGLDWTRLDDRAGIQASDSGWDAGMISYPHVFDHRGRRYMLYCGSEFSKEGFGLAVHV